MGAQIVQVDYEDLAQIIDLFFEEADRAEALRHQIRAQMDSLERGGWVGAGADRFYAEMMNVIFPALLRLNLALSEAGIAAREILDLFMTEEEAAAELLRATDVSYRATPTMMMPGFGAGLPLQDGHLYDQYGKAMPRGDMEVLFVNGIQNDDADFKHSLSLVNDIWGERGYSRIGGIYNDTEGKNPWGFFWDVDQAFDDRVEGTFGARMPGFLQNKATSALVEQISYEIEEGDGTITLIAHSQGGAITASALQQIADRYSPEQMKNIHIITFGSFGTDYPAGPSYAHFVHSLDPVPQIAQGLDMLTSPVDMDMKGWQKALQEKAIYYDNLHRHFNTDSGDPHNLADYLDNYAWGEFERSSPAEDIANATAQLLMQGFLR